MTSSVAISSFEPHPPELDRGGWKGRLELDFERDEQGTSIARRWHSGPYLVQKPFYEKSGACQVYLIHPPAGIVGGDQLLLSARLGKEAHSLLTVPAATKFYRSLGPVATNRMRFELGEQAVLEWLPQETIYYRGARGESRTQVRLGRGARFITWEISCLGRPAAGERFDAGSITQSVEIGDESGPIWRERLKLDSGDPLLDAAWGLDGHPVVGTLLASSPNPTQTEDFITLIREGVRPERGLFSVSQLGRTLVCRYLGPTALEARRAFEQVWGLWRPSVLGIEKAPPRIWAT